MKENGERPFKTPQAQARACKRLNEWWKANGTRLGGIVSFSKQMGFSHHSAFHQYLNGKIDIGPTILIKLRRHGGLDPLDILPEIRSDLLMLDQSDNIASGTTSVPLISLIDKEMSRFLEGGKPRKIVSMPVPGNIDTSGLLAVVMPDTSMETRAGNWRIPRGYTVLFDQHATVKSGACVLAYTEKSGYLIRRLDGKQLTPLSDAWDIVSGPFEVCAIALQAIHQSLHD